MSSVPLDHLSVVDPVAPSTGELRAKAARGGAITLVAQGLKASLRIGSTMVLARLLAPEDFGLQGMVLVVSGFVSLFKDAGLGLATVQRKTITHDQTSMLFWINAGLGLLLAVALVALAPTLASFYNEPRLRQMAVVSALAFVLSGLAVQHQALLQRKLRFTALAVVDITAIVLSTAMGIVMAMTGYGYWSLVAMVVSLPAVTLAGVWIAVPWLPSPPRRGQDIRSMLRLGGTWTFVSLVSYVSYNIEKLLLGRFWGAQALGLYGRAYQLTSLPVELMSSVGSVVVSTLSRLQHDPEKLRRAFIECYSLVVSLTLPVVFMVLVAAEEIVGVVLGPQWKDAGPILRALAPTTLALSLMCPFAWLLQATALNRVTIGTTLLVPPIVITSIVVGLNYGQLGVAIGYSTGVTLMAIPVIAWCRSAAKISGKGLWDAMRRPLWAGLLAAIGAAAVKFSLGGQLSNLLALIAETLAFVVIYAGVLLVVFDRRHYYVGIVRTITNRSETASSESTTPSLDPARS